MFLSDRLVFVIVLGNFLPLKCCYFYTRRFIAMTARTGMGKLSENGSRQTRGYAHKVFG